MFQMFSFLSLLRLHYDISKLSSQCMMCLRQLQNKTKKKKKKKKKKKTKQMSINVGKGHLVNYLFESVCH